MMKKVPNKNPQAPKGNLKISNFFTSVNKSKTNATLPKSKLSLVKNSQDIIEVIDITENSKKRKLSESKVELYLESPLKKTSVQNIDNKPSTSEVDGTPTKILYIKTPEKLLTPKALKEYLTPEKNTKNPFIKTPSKTTPKKIDFDQFIVRSPLKTPPKPIHNSPKTSSVKKLIQKTPSKSIKTPKKLFEKSPAKIGEFNVQVIDNFVKITPSKSSENLETSQLSKNSPNKQTSILDYISPSKRSQEAQKANEKTPTKQTPKKDVLTPQLLKIKSKLDFSTSDSKTVHEEEKENFDLNDMETMDLEEFQDELLEGHSSKTQKSPLKKLWQDDSCVNFDDDWNSEDFEEIDYKLDLSTNQHCKIMSIDRMPVKTILKLKSTQNGDMGLCELHGFWLQTNLEVNNIVNIKAGKNEHGSWFLNNDTGLLVFEPDYLVSSTSVTNTVFCKRKAIFQDQFRGFEPANRVMLVGIAVHEVLQTVLKNNLKTFVEIRRVVKGILETDNMIRRIYETGEAFSTIEMELNSFIPKVAEFVENYVTSKSFMTSNSQQMKDNWKGVIHSVEDIEENIWCPDLGIKGKVDVSVRSNDKILPLELKTGRATVSLEHRGQVLLYIMMMNKLGYNVKSGLLLYLREGVLREVKMTAQEQRDIIMLRNDLAYYLTKNPKIKVNDQKEKYFEVTDFPEPINHPACAKCPYQVVCTSYLKYHKTDISSNKTLQKIQEEVSNVLTDSHLEYIMKWVSLLAIENNQCDDMKEVREIYTLKPEEREAKGKSIINLNLTEVGEELNSVFEHTFETKDSDKYMNFMLSGILEGNYVVVSTNKRPAVSAGFVSSIDKEKISVTLDRNLQIKFKNETFHLDTYESKSMQKFNMASLTILLELTPRADELRQIIIDKKLPIFDTKLPKIIAKEGKPILNKLNCVQQRAVLKALAAKDYLLIKGMPGTGKTATIVALIQLLVKLNKSVIITSHTHSAVDNVCMKLASLDVKLMRLGSESRIHRNVKKYSEFSLTKHCKTPEELDNVYQSQQVIAVTCLGSGHPILSKRTVDICIVDESTQVLQTSVIRPLYSAKTFILIGDPDQLPNVVKNKDAMEMGMTESIFDRLNRSEAVVALNLNYRMNKYITALANALTYNGELKIGTEEISNANLKLPNKEVLMDEYKDREWILKMLDNDLEKSVQLIDTGPVWKFQDKSENEDNKNNNNLYEAGIIVHLVNALLKAGVTCDKIGVIATYRVQVLKISSLLASTHVDVSTVDQYQGKDKNIIIYSCTKSKDPFYASNDDLKLEILDDKRRLNVAITRAKNKLIMVGDVSTLKLYSIFQKILPFMKNVYKVEDNVNGFKWDDILECTKE